MLSDRGERTVPGADAVGNMLVASPTRMRRPALDHLLLGEREMTHPREAASGNRA